MSWLDEIFAKPVELTEQQAERLAAWQSLPAPSRDFAFDTSRYVVVDVESSGLNIRKDHLIAIGAVAVTHGKVQFDDSIEIVLQQTRVSSKDNILIHGIGGAAQRAGIAPVDGLLDFLEYLGKAPLIAFHVGFDAAMISRAVKIFLGYKFQHAWVDLAYIAPALHPQLACRCRSLDDWMGIFKISNYARHNALADALSTAELLLVLLRHLQRRGVKDLQGLKFLEREGVQMIRPS